MVKYEIIFSKRSYKDRALLKAAKLDVKTKVLLKIIEENPSQTPPPYESLGGDLEGFLSKRINRQHRLVYQVLKKRKIVHVLRMWTHYE